MKKHQLLLIWSLSAMFFGCGLKAVLFGEHKPNISQDFYTVFIDQYGDYYPEKKISNSKIKSAGSNLDLLYRNNVQPFNKQFPDLKLDSTQAVPFETFQEKLIEYHGAEINKRMKAANATSVTFILVGYNNTYKSTSEKLESLRNKIYTLLNVNSKKTLIVELYWDGKAMMFGADAISIFNNSQANSYNVGIQLRLLVNQLKDTKDVYFISHSLGANVVTECLFNQMKKVQDDSRLGVNSVKNFLTGKYSDPKYILDNSKQYHAAIVAPAIPGVYTFEDYDERGYAFDKNKDNYKIIAGINTHDIVLNKFIGKTTLFGATSFGCRTSEVNEVFNLYTKEYMRNRIDTVDFSKRKDKHHGLEYYMKAAEYERMLKKLFEI